MLGNLQLRCVQILKRAGRVGSSRNTAPPGGIGSIGKDFPQYVLSVSAPCVPLANLAQDCPLDGTPPGNGSRQSCIFEKSARSPTAWRRSSKESSESGLLPSSNSLSSAREVEDGSAFASSAFFRICEPILLYPPRRSAPSAGLSPMRNTWNSQMQHPRHRGKVKSPCRRTTALPSRPSPHCLSEASEPTKEGSAGALSRRPPRSKAAKWSSTRTSEFLANHLAASIL